MKKMKRMVIIFSIIAVVFTTIIVVHAQEVSKQLNNFNKVKLFLKTDKIEILDNYNEDGYRVFKVYDEEKDEYYKLALNKENNIDWYDNIKYGVHSKMGSSLSDKIKEASDEEKIDVMVELNFDYVAFDKELDVIEQKQVIKGTNQLNSADFNQDGIRAEKVKYIKQKMLSNNKIPGDYEISYSSQFSPFIFLKLTKSEISELMENDRVYEINYVDDTPLELSDVVLGASRFTVQNNAITATRTNVVKNAGKTGSGVKIGQLESSLPDTTNSTLIGKSITTRMDNCIFYNAEVLHATEVASIMIGDNGVAPGAQLYSACVVNMTQIASAIEWLISQNVDVINMSAGLANQGYNQYDRYIDAITCMNDILFVAAAGNIGSNGYNNTSSPSYAYNVLTIGNIVYEGTSYVDAMNSYRHSSSFYVEEGLNQRANKPEMVAPGTNVNYSNSYGGTTTGNSFSAPLVTGATALLMQSTPSTKNNFQTIKAALFATARPMNNYPNTISNNVSGWLKTFYHYNNEVGLGILDTKAAYDLLRWGQYRNATVNGGQSDSYIYNNTLGNGMDVRVAITWSKPNTTTGLSNINNCGTDRVADLDLQILGPNGDKVARSISSYDNVEWVHFVTNQGYGTYQFKVINYATNGNTVPTKVSMAWW